LQKKLNQGCLQNHKIMEIRTPFFSYDQKWFGLGIGLHLGNLSIITENLDKEGRPVTPETGTLKIFGYPQGYLRVGPRKWAFADIHIADQFPSALTGFRYQLGIGSGFGKENQARGRIGATWPSISRGGLWDGSLNFHGAYVSGYFPINDKYVLEPTMVYTCNPHPDGTEVIKTREGYQISLGIGYRFGHELRKKP
jgi:hypothetical protein